jgi:hypothetical protein
MKKLKIWSVVIFFSCLLVSVPAEQSSFLRQFSYTARRDDFLVPAGNWVYEAVSSLYSEEGKTCFVTNAPLSIRELKAYLFLLDYESLTLSGRNLYDSVMESFAQTHFTFGTEDVSAGISLLCNPELYYKSNPDIPWTYGYTDKQHILDIPVYLNFGNNIAIETDPFVGKNYWTCIESSEWNNIPNPFRQPNEFEFLMPKTAYISSGIPFGTSSGVNVQFGRGALSAGNTQMESVFLSEKFDTDCYGRLILYSPILKYTGDIIQVESSTYFYLHEVQIRPFSCFQISVMEGAYINEPFELRYCNPLMILHSFSYWRDYKDTASKTDDDHTCAYFGLNFDYTPFKFVRIYGVYAQTEIQTSAEKESTYGQTIPNGFGFQLGSEITLPAANGGRWKIGLEGLYTNPWLYVKQQAGWSMFSSRYDNLRNTSEPINTWVGSPAGPDSIAAQLTVSLDSGKKWSAAVRYRFLAHGENSYNLFYNSDGTLRTDYYPSIKYKQNLDSTENLIALANETSPTGTPEFSHRITCGGTYIWNDRITTSCNVSYVVVFNTNNTEGAFSQGFETVLSASFRIL